MLNYVGRHRPGHTPRRTVQKKGGYSGGRPASEMGPPMPLPSATIRPKDRPQ